MAFAGPSYRSPEFYTAQVFSGILVIGFIGLGTDALIRGINSFLFRWREESV